MIKWFKKYWPKFVWVIVGMAAGFLYYSQIGCLTGSCPISSNPLRMVVYGAVIGFLLSVVFSGSGKWIAGHLKK